METHRKIVTVIILIVILGFTLRVYHLGRESLWLDEGGSVRLAQLAPTGIITEVIGNFHPPLYFLLLHGWIAISGASEFSVRLLSALIGTCSIFLIYRVGRLFFNQSVGIMAALLLCLSRFHIFYSQEARMYSLLVLLTLASMYYFIKLIRGNYLSDKAWYLLFSVLLLYTHNMGLFIIIAQNLFLFSFTLFSRNRTGINLKKWLLLQGLLIVIYLPWLIVVFKQLNLVSHSSWSVPTPEMATILHTFVSYSGTRLLSILFALLLLSSIINFQRPAKNQWRFPDAGKIYLFLIWLAVPVILPFVVSRLSTPIYIHKVTIGALPALCLLVSRGIDRIHLRSIRIPVIVLFVILALFNLKHYYKQTHRDQWREAARYIDSYAADGDLVVCDPPSTFRDIFAYYRRRTGLNNKRITRKNYDITPANIQEVLSKIEAFSRIWVILSYQGLEDEGLIKETLGGIYALSRRRQYSNRRNVPFHGYEIGLKVYLFVKKLKPDKVGEDDIQHFINYLRRDGNQNMVNDSGFEVLNGDWDPAEEWITGEIVHTGDRAIHVRWEMAPPPNFHHISQGPIKLKTGHDYFFGAFVKTKQLRDGIRIEIMDINNRTPRAYYSTGKITGDNDWTLLLGVFKTGSRSGKDIEVEFRPARLNNFREGEFWVDDAFIIPYNHFPRF